MRADDRVTNAQSHPTDEELRCTFEERPAEGGSLDHGLETIRRHVETCEICLLRRNVLQRGGWSSGGPAPGDCPQEPVWYAIAGGTAPSGQAQHWLAHASVCHACARELQQAVQDLHADLGPDEEAAIAQLATSRPEWPREFARRLVLEPSGLRRTVKSPWFDWKAAIALVASASSALVVGLFWYNGSALRVENLLASSYKSDRTIEFRLPGSPYAPQGQVLRGQTGELPSDLLEAKAITQRKAGKHPASSTWLDLKGRSEILTGDPDAAIATLTKGLEEGESNVAVLNDLSVAYASRSESRSSPDDLRAALRFNDKALQQDPRDAVALFNRALVEEKLGQLNNAANSMRQFLQAHPDDPWVPEAHQKLQQWEPKLREHSSPPANSPGAFLEHHADSELYVEAAVREWLPHMDDATTRSALQQLASELAAQHGDRWLQELLDQPIDPDGMRSLAAANDDSLRGDYSGALRDARFARQRFEQVSARAASSRAQFELAYAELRLLSGKTCRPDADELLREVQGVGYPYLETQAWLEASVCDNFRGNFGQAIRDADKAISLAHDAKLRVVGMRAWGLKASSERTSGNPELAWEICQAGLLQYWKAVAPPMRAYHFLTELEVLAEDDADWLVAKSYQQEALHAIELDQDMDLRATAHFRMAFIAVASGDTATADREFQIAAELFRTAPDQKTAKLHELESRVGLAAIQLRRGALQNAQRNLDVLDLALQNNDDVPYYMEVQYQAVRGDIARAQKQWDIAEAAYAKGVNIAEDALPRLNDAKSRLLWSAKTEHAYRELVAIRIVRHGDTVGALQLWQAHCSAALRSGSNSSWKNFGQPAAYGPGQLRLTYLLLDDQLAIWVTSSNGIQYRSVSVRPDELDRESRLLLSLCSRPDSDPQVVHKLARSLYDVLFTPVAGEVSSASAILVQPDVAMPGIPFEILEDASGEVVAAHHLVRYSPGAGYDHDASSPDVLGRSSMVLVGDSNGVLGSLPEIDGEVQSFRRVFPQSIVLSGRQVNREMLLSALPAVEVLEFVGHGRGSFTGAGLLLRQEQPGVDGLVLDTRLLDSIELSKMKLAVLSACSTARGRRGLLDPHSLVQSFLRAGVGSVVASRWDVDSASTAKLMAAFYQNLARGQSVPEALSMASSNMRAQNGSQPFYWAAFSVYE